MGVEWGGSGRTTKPPAEISPQPEQTEPGEAPDEVVELPLPSLPSVLRRIGKLRNESATKQKRLDLFD